MQLHDYDKILKDKGEHGFYKWAIGWAILSLQRLEYPENELLNQANHFFSLYRSKGDENYFIIAKILRRAAHKVYRSLFKMNKDRPINLKFLNLIK